MWGIENMFTNTANFLYKIEYILWEERYRVQRAGIIPVLDFLHASGKTPDSCDTVVASSRRSLLSNFSQFEKNICFNSRTKVAI